MSDTASVSTAVEKIPPLPNTCRRCGQGRDPAKEQEHCEDCEAELKRAKPANWELPENRQRGFRTRRYRKG